MHFDRHGCCAGGSRPSRRNDLLLGALDIDLHEVDDIRLTQGCEECVYRQTTYSNIAGRIVCLIQSICPEVSRSLEPLPTVGAPAHRAGDRSLDWHAAVAD